ncbi:MAG: hypothetical protein K0Q93_481 [Nocardioidaceae bacterium]|nr:hypothetical protein [Nocardioidaceae bacterium]
MRMMMTLEVPVEAGNEAIKGGQLPQLLEHVLGSLKPEAAYFSSTDDGSRGGYIVFDLEDPSQIPVIVEPLYQQLNAQVRLQPVMTAEDVQRGLSQLGG